MNIRILIVAIAWLGLVISGCTTGPTSSPETTFLYKTLPLAKGSATAGEGHNITFRGVPLSLEGPGISVGDSLRSVSLAQGDLSPIDLASTKGTIRIISVVPSLDTTVCEQQTHFLSERNQGLDQSVKLMTISIDTPFAQARFAKEAHIDNITFLSDYREAAFGKAYGLLVKDPHILARTVLVVDADNIIRYLQVTPELAHMPDMEAAFQAARALLPG